MPRKPAAPTPAAPPSPARPAVQARLSPVELAIVEAARAGRNIPMSEFVRLAVMQYATAQPGHPAPPPPRAPGLAVQVDMSRVEFHLKSQAQAINSMRSVVEQMSTKFDLQAARAEKSIKATERWFRLLLNALGLQPSK